MALPERRSRPHAVLFACGMNAVRSPMAAGLF
jgi:protein-tyrosine-phosphatase